MSLRRLIGLGGRRQQPSAPADPAEKRETVARPPRDQAVDRLRRSPGRQTRGRN